MRCLLGVSILSLMITLAGGANADDAWFRVNTSPLIFAGASGQPSPEANDNIAIVVDTSVKTRSYGDLVIPVAVTGIDGTHTVSVVGMPAGASLVPDGTTYGKATIVWPSAAAGTRNLTIEVRDFDGLLIASQAIEVTVYPPLTASVPQVTYEAMVGDTLEIVADIQNNIGSVLWGANPAALPDWLELDADTGTIAVDTSVINTLSDIVLTAVDQADMMAANTLPFSIAIDALPTNYWVATLGGTAADIASGIMNSADGSIYVVGRTASAGAGGNDLLIAKYDSGGTILWGKTLGGSATDFASGITTGADGSVYVTGRTASAGQGAASSLTVKYDPSGALLWRRILGGTGADAGQGIAAGADGSAYVAGSTTSFGAGVEDFLVAKYNSSGAWEWSKSLGGTGSDFASAIAIDGHGSIYVAGTTASAGAGGNDFLTAKYSSAGSLLWKKTLGGTGSDGAKGIAIGSDGSVYVAGSTASAGAGGTDMLTAKYNSDGTLLWKRTLGGTGSDAANSITADADGSVYVAGSTASAGAGGTHVLVAKYSSGGTLLWKKTLGGTGSDAANSVTAGEGGSIYVAGSTASTGAGGDDFLVARLPSADDGTMTAGAFIWQDAPLMEGVAANLTEKTPSWSSPNAGLIGSSSTALTEGTAGSLTGTTTQLEVD